MKKSIIIMTVCLLIAFTLIACTSKDASNNDDESIPIAETTPKVEETLAIEEETTSEETQPIIDENPMEKMLISADDYSKLLNLWCIDSVDVNQQGDVIQFSLKYVGSFLNLNYFFADSRAEDEIKTVYSDFIQGEWEKDEYSAGAIIEGETTNGNKALCQIIDMGSYIELSVFSSTEDEAKVEEFNALFDSKWANGLVPLFPSLDENNINSMGIEISKDLNTAVYTKGYEYSDDIPSLIEFYKNELISYDDYEVTLDYSNNEVICCSNDGIAIKIYYQEFFNEVVFEYSVPLKSDQ